METMKFLDVGGSILFIRTATVMFTARMFSLCCQFVLVLAKSEWPAHLTEVAPQGVLLPTRTRERNFLSHKCSWDISYSPSVGEHTHEHTQTHTHTHSILKAILIEFPIVNSKCLFPLL